MFPSPCSRTVLLVHAPAGPEEHNGHRPFRRALSDVHRLDRERKPSLIPPSQEMPWLLTSTFRLREISREPYGVRDKQSGEAYRGCHWLKAREVPWMETPQKPAGVGFGEECGIILGKYPWTALFLGLPAPRGGTQHGPSKKRDARKNQTKQINAKNRQTTRKLHLKSLIPRDVHFLI